MMTPPFDPMSTPKKKKPAAKSAPPPHPLRHTVGDDGEGFIITRPTCRQPIAIVPYETKPRDGSPDKGLAKSIANQIAEALSQGLEGGYFTTAFNQRAAWAHETARRKGWWQGEDAMLAKIEFATSTADRQSLIESYLLSQDGKNIALFTSEISEALEALRHGNPPDDKIPEFTGVEAELADVIIRIMDVSQRRGWRVAEAVVAKMNFNSTRPVMHGGKKF